MKKQWMALAAAVVAVLAVGYVGCASEADYQAERSKQLATAEKLHTSADAAEKQAEKVEAAASSAAAAGAKAIAEELGKQVEELRAQIVAAREAEAAIVERVKTADAQPRADSNLAPVAALVNSFAPGFGTIATLIVGGLTGGLARQGAINTLRGEVDDKSKVLKAVVNGVEVAKKLSPDIAQAFAEHGDVISIAQGTAGKAAIDAAQKDLKAVLT